MLLGIRELDLKAARMTNRKSRLVRLGVSTHAWICGLSILLTLFGCGSESPDGGPIDNRYGGGPDRPAGEIGWLSELSNQYYSRIGPTLGFPMEGRFLDDGRFVVVLDAYTPHLHLFRADGEWLWTGGADGDGPGEIRLFPTQSLGTAGRQVAIAQRGRLTLWTLNGDSLALDRTLPLPATYAPQGLTEGCDGDWLLYGRSESRVSVPDEQWRAVEAPELPFLHRMRVEGDTVLFDPLWHDDPELIGWQVGHQGTFLHRTGAHVAVYHRPYPNELHGHLLEFDCGGTLLRSVDELALVTGEPFPVLVPRSEALGTLGIVALDRGFITATRRGYSPKVHDIEEHTTQTELFHFAEGSFQGSVLIPGQWKLFDVDQDGRLLFERSFPAPHFVRVPLDSLFPAAWKVSR